MKEIAKTGRARQFTGMGRLGTRVEEEKDLTQSSMRASIRAQRRTFVN
jgi:hypothetical protein